MVFRHEPGSYGAMMATGYLLGNGAPRSTPAEATCLRGLAGVFELARVVLAAEFQPGAEARRRVVMQFSPANRVNSLATWFLANIRRNKKAVSGQLQGA